MGFYWNTTESHINSDSCLPDEVTTVATESELFEVMQLELVIVDFKKFSWRSVSARSTNKWLSFSRHDYIRNDDFSSASEYIAGLATRKGSGLLRDRYWPVIVP